MNGPFDSRLLGAPDLDLASSLHREAFTPLGERAWSSREMAELLGSPGVAGIVLQQNGEDVAFAVCRTVADEAELLTIVVRADRRCRGAGEALLKTVIAVVHERGARSLFLEVGADNPAALALYSRAGFRTVGHRAGYYSRAGRPAADAVVMQLDLD